MTNKVRRIEHLLGISLIVGSIVFILSLITILRWQDEGFDLLEVSFMSIISGVYFMIVIIVVNIIGLNMYIRDTIKSGHQPILRILQILLIFVLSFVIYLLLDSVFFIFDSSISKEYAESLIELSQKNGGKLEESSLSDFANLPFSLQNGIITSVFALIGSFISLPFIKRDGILIKASEY